MLAEIEALCFPPAEATSSQEEIEKRMCAFLENFFVAEMKYGKIVGFVNQRVTVLAKAAG